MVIPFGAQPIFSADSQWAVYSIGLPEAQEEKLRTEKKPIKRKAGTLNLARGEKTVVDDIESFAFNASGSFLAMRRYAPEPEKKSAGEGSTPPESDGPIGSTLIVGISRRAAMSRSATWRNSRGRTKDVSLP